MSVTVILRNGDHAVIADADAWEYTIATLAIVRGEELVAQFPTENVIGVYKRPERTVDAESDMGFR